MKTRRVETPSPPKPDDEDDIFGKHVASEMTKIRDQRSKGMARVKNSRPATVVSPRDSVFSRSGLHYQGHSQINFNENDISSSNRTYFHL